MYATLLWTSKRFPKICKPLVVYRFYCMALYHSKTRRHMISMFSEHLRDMEETKRGGECILQSFFFQIRAEMRIFGA